MEYKYIEGVDRGYEDALRDLEKIGFDLKASNDPSGEHLLQILWREFPHYFEQSSAPSSVQELPEFDIDEEREVLVEETQ